MKPEDLLSINEAARISGLSRQSIHAAIEKGKIETSVVMEPVRKVVRRSLEAYEPNEKRKNCGPKATEKASKRKQVK